MKYLSVTTALMQEAIAQQASGKYMGANMATIGQHEFEYSSFRFRRKGIEIKSKYTRARWGEIARTRKKYFTKKYLTIRYTLYIFRIYKREVKTMLSTKERIQLDTKNICQYKEDTINYLIGWLSCINASKTKKEDLQKTIEEVKWILEAGNELPTGIDKFLGVK